MVTVLVCCERKAEAVSVAEGEEERARVVVENRARWRGRVWMILWRSEAMIAVLNSAMFCSW